MRRNWLLFLLLAVLLIVQYRLWFGPGSWEEITRLRRQIAEQEHSNAELRERNERLSREVQSLKTDLATVEERARQELGLIREGETFYLVVDEEESK
ncbi:MAG TPA: cell division protein FtsB [Spongiibacteraceae bacterium]|nr:cell division protein FtsB [Spongiibacteraceae bacterium]HCS29009.1 cell division protein FtsB [Spongiibacteraceae bacterium]|tara:strand:+ start:93 stop:383 length:291 start_codon:yes stop_codon:yes gene_type:complete